MSWFKKIFSKKEKKKIENAPEKFNGLYTFKYENIIDESKKTDYPLYGSTFSNSLFLETSHQINNVSFIFLGKSAKSHYPVFKKRLELQSNSLILSELSLFNELGVNAEFIGLGDLSQESQTFLNGHEWYNGNKEDIKLKLKRISQNSEIVCVFTENNGFLNGLLDGLIEDILKLNKQPLLFIYLPPPKANIQEEINALALIYRLINTEPDFSIPFVLLDEHMLLSSNSGKDPKILKQRFRNKIINNFIDLLIGSQLSSEFYKEEFSSFKRVIEGAKGLCSVLSYDIYENSSNLSPLTENLQSAVSLSYSLPTRGYLLFQPGPNGLPVTSYKKFRQLYSNLDVEFSVVDNRSNGALIRGLFSYIDIPRPLLSRFKILSDAVLEVYDENEQFIGLKNISGFDLLFETERFLIKSRPKEE